MTALAHVHPRHERIALGWKPTPARRLHEPLKPVRLGTSQARAFHTYGGARMNLGRYPSRALQLKKERLAAGMTRREYDRYRWYEANRNEDV